MTEAPPPLPAVAATGFTIATPLGTVVPAVTFTLPAGGVAAVTGSSRSGKSTLLLGLTGRMRHTSGALFVDGQDAIHHPARVRRIASVARIADLIVPEPSLTLEDCITERTLMDAASPRARMAHYLHAARLLGLSAPRTRLYGDLPPIDQTRVALALACIRPAALIVLDDLDHHASLDEQVALWDGVRALAEDGPAVIVSTGERRAIPDDALVIDLDSQE